MDKTPIPHRQINAQCNRDEARVRQEVFDLYVFLHNHPSMAENRCIDLLRAAIASTPFVYLFSGLVSEQAATLIDQRLGGADTRYPCHGLQRDHVIPWRDTGRHFLRGPLLAIDDFWPEMKRRNEVALLCKEEHEALAPYQKAGRGHDSYALTGLRLLQVDKRAIVLAGQRTKIVTEYWSPPGKRTPFVFSSSYHRSYSSNDT